MKNKHKYVDKGGTDDSFGWGASLRYKQNIEILLNSIETPLNKPLFQFYTHCAAILTESLLSDRLQTPAEYQFKCPADGKSDRS